MTGPLVGHIGVVPWDEDVHEVCRTVLGGRPDVVQRVGELTVSVRGPGAAIAMLDGWTIAVSGRLDDGPGSGRVPLRGADFARWAVGRWCEHGELDLDEWTGDWALVVVDAGGQVVAARDLCGGRTLFLSTRTGRPLVATRFAGVCDAVEGPLRPDPLFVCSYLMGRSIDVTSTAYARISAVAPGAAASLQAGVWHQRTVVRWHVADQRGVSLDELTDVVEGLLDQAVRDRLHGLDHAAVALSGGVDSGLVAMLAARARPDLRLSAVMMAFEDDIGDERHRQLHLSSALGMEQVWVDPMQYEAFGRDGARETLRRDRFPLPPTNWFLSEAMADGVRQSGAPLVFTGEDADSAFAHNPAAELAELVARGRWLHFRAAALEARAAYGWTRSDLLEATAFWLTPMPVRRRARVTRWAFAPIGLMAPSVIRRVDLRERLFSARPLSSWRPRNSYSLARSAAFTPESLDDTGATLDHFLDWSGAVSGQPFADRRLLSVAAGLRPQHVQDRAETKLVLRRVHARIAPPGYETQSSKAVLSTPSRRSAMVTQRAELLAGLDLAVDRPDWFQVERVSELRDICRAGGFDLEALRVARLSHWLTMADPTPAR